MVPHEVELVFKGYDDKGACFRPVYCLGGYVNSADDAECIPIVEGNEVRAGDSKEFAAKDFLVCEVCFEWFLLDEVLVEDFDCAVWLASCIVVVKAPFEGDTAAKALIWEFVDSIDHIVWFTAHRKESTIWAEFDLLSIYFWWTKILCVYNNFFSIFEIFLNSFKIHDLDFTLLCPHDSSIIEGNDRVLISNLDYYSSLIISNCHIVRFF